MASLDLDLDPLLDDFVAGHEPRGILELIDGSVVVSVAPGEAAFWTDGEEIRTYYPPSQFSDSRYVALDVTSAVRARRAAQG